MNPDQLKHALAELPDWQGDQQSIQRDYRFADFRQAMAWQQACVDGIEQRQHHPEWRNVYNQVSVTLRTHDAGDVVTEKDLDLARYLDQIAADIVR